MNKQALKKFDYFHYRKLKNATMLFLLVLAGIMITLPLLFIFFYVLKNGMQALTWEFLTEMPKPIGESGGGMLHAIVGTVYILLIGGSIGVFWGLGAGIYLSEYGRGNFASLLRFSTDLLSGTPSIVVGLVAYALLVIPLKGFSALAGGVSLAIIILPTIIRTTEEVLKLVPKDIREAGLALGLPRYKVILKIVVFGSRSGLLTGILLGLGRAAGETAPLLFTAFGNMYLSFDLMQPMAALPLQIYNYAISPFEEWQQQAWAGAFLLMLLVLIFNLLAKIFAHWNHIIFTLKKVFYERNKKYR